MTYDTTPQYNAWLALVRESAKRAEGNKDIQIGDLAQQVISQREINTAAIKTIDALRARIEELQNKNNRLECGILNSAINRI